MRQHCMMIIPRRSYKIAPLRSHAQKNSATTTQDSTYNAMLQVKTAGVRTPKSTGTKFDMGVGGITRVPKLN